MISLILMIHRQAGMNGKRLENTLGSRFSKTERELYDSCDSFYRRLCQPSRGGKNEIYVVLADTLARLGKLMAFREILEGRRMVLILPENNKGILSMGQRLLPRYVCCDPENHEEVMSVLEKMIDVMNAGEGGDQRGDGGLHQLIQNSPRQIDLVTGSMKDFKNNQ